MSRIWFTGGSFITMEVSAEGLSCLTELAIPFPVPGV